MVSGPSVVIFRAGKTLRWPFRGPFRDLARNGVYGPNEKELPNLRPCDPRCYPRLLWWILQLNWSWLQRRSVGAVSGSITGFGSVFVDGAEYDDTAATVSDDTDPANPVASTLDALAIGQSVDLSLDSAGRFRHLGIGATLAGPIDAGSIDPNDAGSSNMVANSFTILGQTVTFVPSGAGATLFVGVTDSTQLMDGQQVLVHGPLDASGP